MVDGKKVIKQGHSHHCVKKNICVVVKVTGTAGVAGVQDLYVVYLFCARDFFPQFKRWPDSNTLDTINREETSNTEVSDIDAGENGTLTQGDNSSTLESKTGTLTNGSLEHSAGSG